MALFASHSMYFQQIINLKMPSTFQFSTKATLFTSIMIVLTTINFEWSTAHQKYDRKRRKYRNVYMEWDTLTHREIAFKSC